jgi:hypothetical protein
MLREKRIYSGGLGITPTLVIPIAIEAPGSYLSAGTLGAPARTKE